MTYCTYEPVKLSFKKRMQLAIFDVREFLFDAALLTFLLGGPLTVLTLIAACG